MLRSSLCLSLLSYTRMLKNYLCLNRSGDAPSEGSKDFCSSELPSLNLAGDRSIGNGNSLPIATTDCAMPVPSTGTELQAYSENIMPYNYWWRLPFSADFIFCTLFKHLWNPSFIIASWLPLETACTGIIRVSWKFFLNIPEKVHLHPQQSFLEAQMEQISSQNPIVRPGLM